MVTVTPRKSIRKSTVHKHVGIVADARSLGVTRQHLFYVLTGRRFSPKLIARYRKLKQGR